MHKIRKEGLRKHEVIIFTDSGDALKRLTGTILVHI